MDGSRRAYLGFLSETPQGFRSSGAVGDTHFGAFRKTMEIVQFLKMRERVRQRHPQSGCTSLRIPSAFPGLGSGGFWCLPACRPRPRQDACPRPGRPDFSQPVASGGLWRCNLRRVRRRIAGVGRKGNPELRIGSLKGAAKFPPLAGAGSIRQAQALSGGGSLLGERQPARTLQSSLFVWVKGVRGARKGRGKKIATDLTSLPAYFM